MMQLEKVSFNSVVNSSQDLGFEVAHLFINILFIRSDLAIESGVDPKSKASVLKFGKQLLSHKNFLWFAFLNFVQVSKLYYGNSFFYITTFCWYPLCLSVPLTLSQFFFKPAQFWWQNSPGETPCFNTIFFLVCSLSWQPCYQVVADLFVHFFVAFFSVLLTLPSMFSSNIFV